MDSVVTATEHLLSRVLPQKAPTEYPPRRVIYDHLQPSMGIYRIIQGRVRVCLTFGGAGQVVLGIYSADQFFGQRGLRDKTDWHEKAVAMEHVVVCCWTNEEIEKCVHRKPLVGMCLYHMVCGQFLDLEERLGSLALENISNRLIRALLYFCERQGTAVDNGSIQFRPSHINYFPNTWALRVKLSRRT